MYFTLFLDIFTVDKETLFAALYCEPEGCSEHLFGDGSDHPLQALLEGVGGKDTAHQVWFYAWEEEIHSLGSIHQNRVVGVSSWPILPPKTLGEWQQSALVFFPQLKNHYWDYTMGLFCLKMSRNLARAFTNRNPSLFLNINGNSSDDVSGPFHRLKIWVALIRDVFSLFNCVEDSFNLAFKHVLIRIYRKKNNL